MGVHRALRATAILNFEVSTVNECVIKRKPPFRGPHTVCYVFVATQLGLEDQPMKGEKALGRELSVKDEDCWRRPRRAQALYYWAAGSALRLCFKGQIIRSQMLH